MRFIGTALLALTLIPGAARASGAVCEYANPSRPDWDFFESCDVVVSETETGIEKAVTVANGSRFTTRRSDGAGGTSYTVNGKPAEALSIAGADCYRTSGERETICIHPVGTFAPAVATPGTPAAAAAVGAGAMPGGGEPGFCRLTAPAPGGETLIDDGACQRAVSCQDGEGGETCLSVHTWDNGRETGLYRTPEFLTLDGAPVAPDEGGCVTDTDTGARFCFSGSALTEAERAAFVAPAPETAPAPAFDPASAEVPLVIAAPGTPLAEDPEADAAAAAAFGIPLPASMAEPAEVVEATAPTDSATDAGICAVMKGAATLTSGPCTLVETCEGDACTRTYTLADGSEVALDTLSGEVIGIDGEDTPAQPLSASGTTCVAWIGAPFTFCNTAP